MFSRKLRALNYHSPDEKVPMMDKKDLKPLVVWLEDQKIRHYKIEERKVLRETEGEKWVSVFKKYLSSLECPYVMELDLPAVVDWLLGLALRYVFDEAASSHPEMKCGVGGGGGGGAGSLPAPTEQPSPQGGRNPLNVAPSDPTFISGTHALAKLLQVTSYPDPALLLEATRIVIQERLSESALSEGSKSSDGGCGGAGKSRKYNITAKECGFDLNDPNLNDAAKILRLLHLQELRNLQTRINELIVGVQAVTANPKTDQALGQVGR